VVTLFTWRVIFLTLFVYAVAMLLLCVRSLPETLPRHARRRFGIGILMHDYVAVFGNRRFRLVALAIALSFAGLFLYVASVPAFLGTNWACANRLRRDVRAIVAGIFLGSLAAERLAGRVASTRLILAGFSIQLVTGIVNVTFHAMHAVSVPGSVLPLGFYAFGMSLATRVSRWSGWTNPADAWPGRLLPGLHDGVAGRLVTQLAPTFEGRALALGLVQGVCACGFRCVARHDPTVTQEMNSAAVDPKVEDKE